MADMNGSHDVKPPVQEVYPSFVADNPQARYRWDLCVAIAARLLDEPDHTYGTRLAASHMFRWDDLPTV